MTRIEKAIKTWFATSQGEVRFYPFGLLSWGWVIEPAQRPSLERCVRLYFHSEWLLMIPVILLWRAGFGPQAGVLVGAGLVLFTGCYATAVRHYARNAEGLRPVARSVMLRDMALNYSRWAIRIRLATAVIMAAVSALPAVIFIKTDFKGAMTFAVISLCLAFVAMRISRIYLAQQQPAPQAGTPDLFD